MTGEGFEAMGATFNLFGYNTSSELTDATLQSSSSLLYDGWNLISEIRAFPSFPVAVSTNLFAWVLDLSGSLQGTGGIGVLPADVFDTTNGPVLTAYAFEGGKTPLLNHRKQNVWCAPGSMDN